MYTTNLQFINIFTAKSILKMLRSIIFINSLEQNGLGNGAAFGKPPGESAVAPVPGVLILS
jgi:hypothetical protein